MDEPILVYPSPFDLNLIIEIPELKNNIRRYWLESMVLLNENIVGLDATILMHPRTWEASGHVSAFSDPLVDNKDSKNRYRLHLLLFN